jgi:hypothetical protein
MYEWKLNNDKSYYKTMTLGITRNWVVEGG